MGCEESFITMKLIWHIYLVFSLDNCAHKTPTAQTENQVNVLPNEFHGDETLLTSHKTPLFSLLVMSAKVVVFNAVKPSIKLPLRLVCMSRNVGCANFFLASFGVHEYVIASPFICYVNFVISTWTWTYVRRELPFFLNYVIKF